jgi:hypothetical protein
MPGILSAAPTLQRPVLYSPQHLRRWRAAYGLADQSVVPVVVLGDSVPWGVGGDNTSSTSNANAILYGMCARLRAFFGNSPRTLQQNPGEGYIFPNDSRITVAGAPAANNYPCTPFATGNRLIASTQNLTITTPTGVTGIQVIQGNTNAAFNTGGGTGHSSSGLQDVTCLYSNNGGANTNLSALTNTSQALLYTAVSVTAGQTFEVLGPATAQGYVGGLVLNSAATNGVQVHRVCISGTVAGRLIGGQTSGTPNLAAAADQTQAIQSCYTWNPTPGLIVVTFCANDQQYQAGGGAGSQNDVTITLFQSWVQQFCNQAVTDGWCVLLLGRNRNIGYAAGLPTLDNYIAVLKSIAGTTDHVAFLDVGESWGSYTVSQTDGLLVTNDSHPNKAGHGDVAAMLFRALDSHAENGIVELVPG